ncbi:hypothetical protein MTR67_039424 [Solanum verrucosum]|uniref:Integrase core domain containing protein n=1 Tax=Solanum verrucosum TaxID=315347 RepID=A0AAF0ZR61_SOLVR|nr:hypothetical protein MTR67_039424 [Solanum verrucosum]
MQLPIRNATLSFPAKFWWSIVRHRLSPTHAKNVVTWDRAVILVALMAGEATVPIWHCDRLVNLTKLVDMGLIQDDTNPVAPRKSALVVVPPLSDDLPRDVEQTEVE